MSQITAKINEDNAESLGTDMFEVTWHSGARPEHQVWQGRWYTRKQLETVCGLGTVTGLCGANCGHFYHPVIPGISEPTYTDEELAELNAKENIPIEYNGKQYTKYEALQRQRRLETTMRAQRQEIKLLKDGEASEDDLINARARYRGTSHEYATFSQAMGLPQQRERVTVDGLGNIGQGKYTGGSGKESPVQVPPVGAKVTDKVTDLERLELLKNQEKSVDKSAKSGIINYRSSHNNIPKLEHTYEKIGELDFSDKKAVAKSLYEFEQKYKDSNIEHCRVITVNGEVYEVHGDRYTVNTSILGDKLKGSINEHNHVTGESQYSFSWEDLESSILDGSSISLASDELYRYSMTFPKEKVTADISEVIQQAKGIVFNKNISGEADITANELQHEMIKEACRMLGIKYERVKR